MIQLELINGKSCQNKMSKNKEIIKAKNIHKNKNS